MADKQNALTSSAQGHRGRGGPGRPVPPAVGGKPGATTFQHYGRTPLANTEDDNLATFSLDTDRTSYQLALNWVRNGWTIDPASVRPEEWINSLNYRYRTPATPTEFAVTGTVFEHPLQPGMHMARLGFQAPKLGTPTALNVTLVLDASGSMADGNRVEIARAAASTIAGSMNEDDLLSVVHFTDYVLEEYTVAHAAPSSRQVESSIRWLQPTGATNVQAGLDRGVELAAEARRERPEAHNYVILMSDGVANVDATNPFTILDSAGYTGEGRPIRLITIGVGINNYNDLLAGAVGTTRQRLVPVPAEHRPSPRYLPARKLAGTLPAVRRPDPGPGDLEKGKRQDLAHHRL